MAVTAAAETEVVDSWSWIEDVLVGYSLLICTYYQIYFI